MFPRHILVLLFVVLIGALTVTVGCTPDTAPDTSPEPLADQPDQTSEAPAPLEEADPAPASSEWPDRVVAERGGFVPEGIAYDAANDRFLLGSISEGTLFEIQADGTLTPVVEDPELAATIGIRVDESRTRLLAANSDAGVFQGAAPGQAMLGVYDLGTGERLAMVDLAAVVDDPPADARFFANDVAVGPDGTAYVTDSFMHVIYAVDLDYEASVLHRVEPGDEGLLLNGIAVHPEGFLLVADTTSGGLLRVPLNEPQAASWVDMAEAVPGADGIVWQAQDRLAVVSNSANQVVVLTSEDGWSSADVAGTGSFAMQGTTAAVKDGDIYVVQPVFAGDELPVVERVEIQ